MKVDEKYLWPEPRVMYIARKSTGYTYRITAIGETRASWIAGDKWNYCRYRKSEYTAATGSDHQRALWAQANRWRISQWVQCATPEQLRQIAEIIGYKEAKHA